MLDATAILQLQQAITTEAVSSAVRTAYEHPGAVVFVPDNFERHDLERLLPNRRRARGAMNTSDIEAFATYSEAHAETGATVFIDADAMSARAVLNLGDADQPGHADNVSVLKLKSRAAYNALLAIGNGRQISQQAAAEFLEDWAEEVECFGESSGALNHGAAVAALRKLTIDTARKVESTVGQLSASLSAMEQVKASSENPVPTTIYFTCVPFHGLKQTLFVLRLAIHTAGDKPTLSLRIKNLEGHQEQMAKEFAENVRDAIPGEIPVVIGTYATKD